MDDIIKSNIDKGEVPRKSAQASETLRDANPSLLEPLGHLKHRILERLEFFPQNDAYYNALRRIFSKKLSERQVGKIPFIETSEIIPSRISFTLLNCPDKSQLLEKADTQKDEV